MEKNPFNQLISQIKDISSSSIDKNIYIGIVKNKLPNLVVEVAGIELDKDNLYIDKWILDREDDKLKANDKVVMIREQDIFYIISKVVKVDG